MRQPPAGTVTFLFTDIEGSTRLLTEVGESYGDLLDAHRRLVRDVVDAQGGHEFGTEGDAFFLSFATAGAAVQAAAEIQRRTAAEPAGTPAGHLRVRIGVHTGEGVVRESDYVGLDVHRVARVMSAGHGGQILLSAPTAALVRNALPAGTALRDLGEHRLKDLTDPEHLYQLDVEGLPTEFPPLRTIDAALGNLPVQLTTFIGRERELEEARRALAGTRFLTLTGPGGTGKTRLSIQLAAGLAGEFGAGAWFVPLASVTDPELVATAVADTLALGEVQGDTRPPLRRVLDHLRDREALLVLDNFEQVLDGAYVVSEILRAAPKVTVIATSRAALRLSGEHEFPVPPLRLPDPRRLPDLYSLTQFEAVALFIDRAKAVKPDFEVTDENAPAVAEICARLDGLPLAIELAAARIRLLTPQAMLARLGDRLALLTAGPRDVPARQRTLRQAIAWSHDLLPPPERGLFARMAVFVDGCFLEQADAVCGPPGELGMDVLVGLESLAEMSLVTVREADADEAGPRFGMLETIREFALERFEALAEAPEVRRRHADAYLDLAERVAPKLTTGEAKRWLDRFEPEHGNLRAAIDWAARSGETAIALRLAAAAWRFWQMRGHLQEGRAQVERCLALAGVEEHPRERLAALEAAGGIAYWQLDAEATKSFYQQALDLSREIGDDGLIANALFNLSFPLSQEEPAAGIPLLEESLRLSEKLGDVAGLMRVHWAMGNNLYLVGDLPSGREHLERGLALAGETGDDFTAGWGLYVLGNVEHKEGDRARARDRWRDGLRIFARTRDVTGVVFHLEALARLAHDDGREPRAVRLAASAAALRAASGTGLYDWELLGRDDRPEGEGLTPEEIERFRAEGTAMGLDEAVAYALSEDDGAAGGPKGRPDELTKEAGR